MSTLFSNLVSVKNNRFTPYELPTGKENRDTEVRSKPRSDLFPLKSSLNNAVIDGDAFFDCRDEFGHLKMSTVDELSEDHECQDPPQSDTTKEAIGSETSNDGSFKSALAVAAASSDSDNNMSSNLLQPVVPCKYSYEELELMCEELGFTFYDATEDNTMYEVEMILDHKKKNKETMYLVKWKNYHSKQNTWEHDWNLESCSELISYYESITKPKFKEEYVVVFVKYLNQFKPLDLLTLTKLLALIYNTTTKDIEKLKLTATEMKTKSREILKIPSGKLYKIKRRLMALMKFAEERRKLLISISEWEEEINSSIPPGNGSIGVENNVDLEYPPVHFKFVNDYVTNGIVIPTTPLSFCKCENCYENRNKCCPNDSDGHFSYTRHRNLQVPPGYPIYECNSLCKCGPECINRVVQYGQKVKVAIFRTANGTGWGLKALEYIPKNQFVVEYLGEIITSDEAEDRGQCYDMVKRSYLFDLDYGEDECVYTVDAASVGNVAHFINHSCDPNLHVFAVWIDCHDPNLPRLAFFAKRVIHRGEELTFDYKMVKNRGPPDAESTPIADAERIPCKCKSRNCRKFLF